MKQEWYETEFLRMFEQEATFEEDDLSFEYTKKCDNISLLIKVIDIKKVISIQIVSNYTYDSLIRNYFIVDGEINFLDTENKLVMNNCIFIGDDEFFSNKVSTSTKELQNRFRVEVTLDSEPQIRSYLI